MNIRYKDYEIRPYSNGLCWEIFELREVKSRKDGSVSRRWVSSGKYPADLGYALETIYELELKRSGGDKDLHAAITTAKRLKAELMDIGIGAREALK